METERQIYLLNPKVLSPEIIAVTFAKTSRSPESFREIADELTEERSAQFHEKWVVGYGHSSVAEHAVLHIAIENVSRLAVETIEGNRLASFTEKSTRYQKWKSDAFFVPSEIENTPGSKVYNEICRNLFETYSVILDGMIQKSVEKHPRLENERDAAWERRRRSICTDAARFLLPAASLANVGVTANARVLENAIRKMLSSPLAEVRQIGEEIKQVTRREVPTLVKYADAVPYLKDTTADMAQLVGEWSSTERKDGGWCSLVSWQPDGEDRVLASAIYRFTTQPYEDIYQRVVKLPETEKQLLAHLLLDRLGQFDVPLRELEHTLYTFDVMMDQGAYFEVKRHRMMTQTAQPLTAELGYCVPRLISETGYADTYRRVMDAAGAAYRKLANYDPNMASYVVPNGFRRRVLMTMNLREAYHFCSLRAAENAHFSARRVALRIAEMIQEKHPLLSMGMKLPDGATWQQVEAENFSDGCV
jgi:thymidylate synthase ThyX